MEVKKTLRDEVLYKHSLSRITVEHMDFEIKGSGSRERIFISVFFTKMDSSTGLT
jgi:hypothetical protein